MWNECCGQKGGAKGRAVSERIEAAIHRINQAGLLALCELPPIARQAYLLRLLPSSHDRPVRDAIEAVMMKNGPVVLPGMSITPVQIEQKLQSIVGEVQETARRIENGEDPLFDQSMLQVTQSKHASPKPAAAPPTPMPETKIRFFCDQCQAALHAPPAHAGTRGKCPHCHERTPVPLRSTRVSGQKHPSETPGAGGAAKTSPKPTVVPTLAPAPSTVNRAEDGMLQDLAMSSYLDEREQNGEPDPIGEENEAPLVEPPVIDKDKVDQWKKVFGDSHAK